MRLSYGLCSFFATSRLEQIRTSRRSRRLSARVSSLLCFLQCYFDTTNVEQRYIGEARQAGGARWLRAPLSTTTRWRDGRCDIWRLNNLQRHNTFPLATSELWCLAACFFNATCLRTPSIIQQALVELRRVATQLPDTRDGGNEIKRSQMHRSERWRDGGRKKKCESGLQSSGSRC